MLEPLYPRILENDASYCLFQQPGKVAYFGGIPLKRQLQAVLEDQQPQRYRSGRNELIRRLLADTCEMCDSTVKVEIHHIRALRDLNGEGHRERPK